MGAAAVFETAAETPPTGGSQYTFVGGVPPVDIGVIYGGSVSSVGSMSGIVGSKHTQEVHHEGGHAQDLDIFLGGHFGDWSQNNLKRGMSGVGMEM
jgi:hypothetical protein